jgi:uncharacterized repeat protein (TIGR01451 family)
MKSRILRFANRFAAKFVLVMLAAIISVPACSVHAPAAEQLVQSFELNSYKRVLDGQWEGIRYASDGNVYFGSSTHSAHHGASFFKYDSQSNQISLLAEDITTICGEDPQTNPQGKLHSDIVEANGWLYMTTHFSSEFPGAWDTWTGSHALGYELATGTFRDYGVIHPNYTSYSAVGVDPVRNYLYVFVTGQTAGQVSYLYRIDTITGDKTNLGQVSDPSNGGFDASSFWTFVDSRGDVWFSIKNQDGALRRVHGDTGQIDVYPNALPPLYRWDTNQVETDATAQAKRFIEWMQPLDGDRAVFTLSANGGMLYMFDSSKPIGSGQEFQNIRHIGYTNLGMAVGSNRVFYYQRANRGFGHQEAQDFHLMSVSLDPNYGYPITDHGLLKDQDGRLVWRTPGMMTDGQGGVFMIGDWWTIPGDLGTLRYNYNGGDEIYEQLPRGEFFAVANVSISAPTPTDLSISATDSPDPIATNGQLTYTIQVTNNASTEATGLVVTDMLPANVTFVSATSASGTCTTFGNSVNCTLPSLSAGSSATITIIIKPLAVGTCINTVSVSANEFDPDTNNNSASQTTTVTVPETVQFSAYTYSVAENGGSLLVTVTRSGTGVISVQYATGNNTAVAGSDYTDTSGILNFAAGEATKSFAVPITSDTSAEGNESLNLTLSSAVGAAIGQKNRAVLTILDNDTFTPPTLDFTAVTFAVSESTATKTITVSRTGDSAGTVSVTWSAASNTATLGTDFTASGGVLTFGPGVTSQSFLVNITNDTIPEGNESGHLILSNPTGGAKIGIRRRSTLTIIDNDVSALGFKFSATSYTTSESGSKLITVSRTSSTAAQSVTLTTSNNGTAVAGTDYTTVTTTLDFAVNETSKTASIPILSDTIVEKNESINLKLSNPTNGGTLGTQRTSVLFITDNDTNGMLQFQSISFSVGESGPTATITVKRTGGTYGTIGVKYATSNNTATTGSDFTGTSGTLTFAQGETSKNFSIPILNDTTWEGAESINLTLSNPTGGGTLGQARQAVLIITDND